MESLGVFLWLVLAFWLISPKSAGKFLAGVRKGYIDEINKESETK